LDNLDQPQRNVGQASGQTPEHGSLNYVLPGFQGKNNVFLQIHVLRASERGGVIGKQFRLYLTENKKKHERVTFATAASDIRHTRDGTDMDKEQIWRAARQLGK